MSSQRSSHSTPASPASDSPPPLYVGLMSGTSMDGVDAVLASFADDGAKGHGLGHVQVHAHASADFTPALRAELMALNQRGGSDELHRAALAANGLAQTYAQAVQAVLQRAGRTAQEVRAIGAHGQTVRHQPGLFDGHGYTLQLNSPALLAELCAIDVVADFRSRDVAAGGQGAPLAPAFHAALFSQAAGPVAVLNLGGIANLSLLPPIGSAEPVRGFDTGPANALMDHWCLLHRQTPYDADGAWAASGQVLPALLEHCLAEPYFAQDIPKSTGRDLFHTAWLAARLADLPSAPAAADVQATLAELTVRSVVDALLRFAPDSRELIVCGGGARNSHLMARLRALLPQLAVLPSDDRGLPAQQVEAAAFAWLAHQTLEGRPGNLPAVTGAHGLRVLGAIYPT